MLPVAKVLKSNGTDGGVLVSAPGIDPSQIKEPVYIEFDALPVPFFILDCAPHGANKYVLHLNDVLSLEDAEELVGSDLMLPEESVEGEDETDFTGWRILDKGVFVGTVSGYEPIPGNLCLYVDCEDGSRAMIPVHEDLILSCDPDSGQLDLDIPAGLVGSKRALLASPPKEGRILLHSCCAPCSGAILEYLVGIGIRPVVFFSNSNITPFEEYVKRRAELERYCDFLGVEWVEDEYDHDTWRREVACGMEDEPERGPRCLKCFRFRLERAARYAVSNGFAVLTTTLAASRWKSLEQVDRAGMEAVATADPSGKLVWWGQNWRKGGLQPRRNEIIREKNFYNQLWCGCEFSGQLKNG